MTPPSPTTRQEPVTVRVFTQRFSSTPRGARLARRLVLHQLDAWGVPYCSEVSDTAALLVAELAANAVTHGRVPGRDFEVAVQLLGRTLRVEVSDTRGEHRPPAPGAARTAPPPLAETGRGLLLVEALADRWEVLDRLPVGKTVVAELDLPGWTGPDRRADMP
ncbi:ATP-binding protein [Streptomyces sp. NY05-11A]|uniref:ATP-binding protein n=1 Tax=Streptomyces soliscabiei TaxID=588897 RepID=UPI0029B9985B|nr:ATP-binding protein [Streptomyces sp. NY05-11A]MDX2680025.1 ATP-binding protein [Streptomyces sp. NY05-11A]